MFALPPRAPGLAAAFVSLVVTLLPLAAHAQPAATVQWGSYLGGVHPDRISAVVKSGDFAYAVGTTSSPSLVPSAPAGQPQRQSPDIFVARFTVEEGTLSTTEFPLLVFGGDGVDEATSVIVGPGNALYIVGTTTSSVAVGISPTPATSLSPPTADRIGGSSAFVAKVLSNGTLDWFMFLGGNGADVATGIVPVGNNVYVTGWTRSTNFMGADPSQVPGGANGFVVNLQVTASPPVLGWDGKPTLIGGTLDDMFNGITVAGTSKLYVAGTTYSTAFPSSYAPEKIINGQNGGITDALVARLDVASGSMDWIAFVGGQWEDQGKAIAMGSNLQSIVVAGSTTSPNLGTGPQRGSPDAFAAWLYPTGRLKFSEVLQGELDDEVLALTTDENGNAYIGGRTASGSFPRLSASGFDTSIEAGVSLREGFVWLAPFEGGDGWVSFVGGNGVDEVTSLSLLTSTRLMIGLQTASGAGLPGSLTYDASLSAPPDGYLLRVDVRTINGPANVSAEVFVRRQPDNIRENEATTSSITTLAANWTPFSMVSDVTRFDWAIGTLENYTLARTWAPVGLNYGAVATDLQLQPGTRYYVTVRATNTFGLTAIKRSGGILVTYPDGGVPPPPADAGTPDSGTPDPGTPDAGTPDAGTADAGTDGGTPGPGDGGGGDADKEPQSPVGFGCAAGGGAMPLLVLLGLLALTLLSRRLGER